MIAYALSAARQELDLVLARDIRLIALDCNHFFCFLAALAFLRASAASRASSSDFLAASSSSCCMQAYKAAICTGTFLRHHLVPHAMALILSTGLTEGAPLLDIAVRSFAMTICGSQQLL